MASSLITKEEPKSLLCTYMRDQSVKFEAKEPLEELLPSNDAPRLTLVRGPLSPRRDPIDTKIIAMLAFIAAFTSSSAQIQRDMPGSKPQLKPGVERKLSGGEPPSKEIMPQELPTGISKDELNDALEPLGKKVEALEKALTPKAQPKKSPATKLRDWLINSLSSAVVDTAVVLGGLGATVWAFARWVQSSRNKQFPDACTGHMYVRGKDGVLIDGLLSVQNIEEIWRNPLVRKKIYAAEQKAKRVQGFPFLVFGEKSGEEILRTLRSHLSASVDRDRLREYAKKGRQEFTALAKKFGSSARDLEDDVATNPQKFLGSDVVFGITYEEIKRRQPRIVMMHRYNVLNVLGNLEKWWEELPQRGSERERFAWTIELAISAVLYRYPPNSEHPIKCLCGKNEDLWNFTLNRAEELKKILVLERKESLKFLDCYVETLKKNQANPTELDTSLNETQQNTFDSLWKPRRSNGILDWILSAGPPKEEYTVWASSFYIHDRIFPNQGTKKGPD